MISTTQPAWTAKHTQPPNMHASPAFTTVSTRRHFDRTGPTATKSHVVMASHQPAPPPNKAREWPPKVRQYVQRSFAEGNTIPNVTRTEMEARLKKLISQAAESNTLLTLDWDHLALPQQMIIEERNKSFLSPVASDQSSLSSLQFQETNISSNGSPPRKRKSSDLVHEPDIQASTPPWRSNANQRKNLEDRTPYADKRARIDYSGDLSFKPNVSLESRKNRFEALNRNGIVSPYLPIGGDSTTPDVDQGPVVGRCQTLEKKYFRLTSAPNPDTVRPLPVLEKTLELLKKKWRQDNNYSYICDQFKSLRQDLTVQHIKTEFTVTAYEIHARIALEKGDLGEYNQCQTQLRALYRQNLGGHPNEFKAYRILYFIHTCNRTDMNDVLADLTSAEKKAPAIKHALEARSSLALGNYHRFFKLYLETPNMGAYLMDMFVTRERLAALANMCKAYKPEIKLRFVTEELGFESDEESARFVCDHGGQDFLEEKDGAVRLGTSKAASIFELARKAAFQKVDIKGQI